jgi:hypothetical protein
MGFLYKFYGTALQFSSKIFYAKFCSNLLRKEGITDRDLFMPRFYFRLLVRRFSWNSRFLDNSFVEFHESLTKWLLSDTELQTDAS